MTAKQKQFVREYLVDLNATKAAERAGYSPKTASEQGARLLGNVRVKEAVERAMEKRAAKVELSQELVVRNLMRLASLAERAGQFAAAVRANELLGKHLAMFTEKVEHVGLEALIERMAQAQRQADEIERRWEPAAIPAVN